jgi:AraC-like DNA-binding protein
MIESFKFLIVRPKKAYMTSHDALSQILQDLRPKGVSYGHCRLTRPWGVHMPAERMARLHVVIAGESWLWGDEIEPIHLEPGDAAFLPRGVMHAMADKPSGHTWPLSDFPSEQIGERTFQMTAGGGGIETLMACCAVRFDEPALHPLLELMPNVIVVRRATVEDDTLPALLDAMADEVMTERMGAATVLSRLADVVIVRLIRAWGESRREPTGWLAALRDKNIGRALIAIHKEPGRAWPLEELADTAGLSRSMFCDRFMDLVGIPPARYLKRWRMHLASRWLEEGRMSIAQIATRLDYGSEVAFGRAFKRIIGTSPGEFRRLSW